MSIFVSQYARAEPWVAALTDLVVVRGTAPSSQTGGAEREEASIDEVATAAVSEISDLASAVPAGPLEALELPPLSADAGEAWLHRGYYTDISVGGDGQSFYLIDSDTSLTID